VTGKAVAVREDSGDGRRDFVGVAEGAVAQELIRRMGIIKKP
jgi:hypothetical protein